VVILRQYTLLIKAQLARLELASNGIDSVILDEALGSTAPYLIMDSGIRLAVADEDEQRADEILKEMSARDSVE